MPGPDGRMGGGDFFRRLDAMIYARCLREWQGIYPLGSLDGPNYCLEFVIAGAVGMARSWALQGFPQAEEALAAWPIGSSPLVSPARFSTSIDFLIFRSIFLWKSPVEKMKEIVAGPFFFR